MAQQYQQIGENRRRIHFAAGFHQIYFTLNNERSELLSALKAMIGNK